MSDRSKGTLCTTSLRIPRTLLVRVQETAREREVGKSFLICRAIEEYLDRLVPLDQLLATREDGHDE